MIAPKHNLKWPELVFIIISLLLLGYTISRAYILSFTFDEAYTYMSYVKDTYWNIFTYKFLTSNGHVLNSLLMKLSTEIFQPSDFTLRLQSILGHILFLLSSWAVLKNIRNPWFRIGGFILVNFNPFVLDFFSLARGYGLAGGLMMMSIYYLKCYIQSTQKPGFWLALCFISAGLASMANFTWLNYMLSMTSIVLAWAAYTQFILKKRNYFWRSLVIIIISGGPFFAYLFRMTIRLKVAKELYYGGRKGFWGDTVGSIIDSTYYYAHYPEIVTILIKSFIIFIPLAGLAFLAYRLFIKKEAPEKHGFFIAVSAILAVSVISTIIQHALFDNSYLTDRTAILLIDLFEICASYLLYYLYESFKPTFALMGILVVFSLYHFVHVMNFTNTKTWIEQADIKNMMRDLDQIRLQKNPAKTDWFNSVFWKCCPAADFYRDVYHYTWLNTIEVGQPTLKENYFFFPENDHLEIAQAHFKMIKKYPVTDFALYENLDPTPRTVFASKSLAIEPGEPECKGANLVKQHAKTGEYSVYLKEDDYSPALSFPVGAFKGDSCFRAEASVWVYFDNKNKRSGELVISIEDSEKKVYQWSALKFDRDFEIKDNWAHIKFGDWAKKIHTDKDILKVFVHDNGKYPIYVDNLEAKVIK